MKKNGLRYFEQLGHYSKCKRLTLTGVNVMKYINYESQALELGRSGVAGFDNHRLILLKSHVFGILFVTVL